MRRRKRRSLPAVKIGMAKGEVGGTKGRGEERKRKEERIEGRNGKMQTERKFERYFDECYNSKIRRINTNGEVYERK